MGSASFTVPEVQGGPVEVPEVWREDEQSGQRRLGMNNQCEKNLTVTLWDLPSFLFPTLKRCSQHVCS